MYTVTKLTPLPWMHPTVQLALACTSPRRTVLMLIADAGDLAFSTGSGQPLQEEDLTFAEEQALRLYMHRQIHLANHLSQQELRNAALAFQN